MIKPILVFKFWAVFGIVFLYIIFGQDCFYVSFFVKFNHLLGKTWHKSKAYNIRNSYLNTVIYIILKIELDIVVIGMM